MHLNQLMDPALLAEMIDAKYVREQTHPVDPELRILNYTERAQFDRVWNDVTRQCRGLIVRHGEVMARPFPKFFNHGEPDAPHLEAGRISVFDKLDGSLGILYRNPSVDGGYAVATRGSFGSEQAACGTLWLIARPFNDPDWKFTPAEGVTYLFEILYPENRIVVDYGGYYGLILLDILDNVAGAPRPDLYETWPGRRVDEFQYQSVTEVLAAEPRPNREGFVIYHHDTGHRVKVKYDEYVRLHRLVTGVNERRVWDLLANGTGVDELLDRVPDEFHQWVTNTVADLTERRDAILDEVQLAYQDVCAKVDVEFVGEYDTYDRDRRKTFAGFATQTKYPAAMFAILDGKGLLGWAWKQVYPDPTPPFTPEV